MRYYSIDEASARLAHDMMSMSDYKEGSKTAEYRRMVDAAAELAERQKQRTDPMHHEKIDHLLDTYARKLANNMNQASRIGCMCPSILCSGGGNFPIRKKERQNAAMDRNMAEFRKIQGLLDQIRGAGTGGISGDDPNALEKLREKVEALEKRQEMMKAANAAIRVKSAEEGDAKLAQLGYGPDAIRQLRAPDFAGRVGYAPYALSNNNANIRRIRARIAELEMRQTEETPGGWEFEGGEVVVNTKLNRLQIVFEDKPDDDVRGLLKSQGFRWAPSQGAWQRQLTANALYAAKHIPGIAPAAGK